MTRVKGGTVSKNRRRKVLKQAKGYFGSKHRLYKSAQEQVFHSGAYSYQDRKKRKGDFRKLWITRLNAACRENDISYSRFIDGLNKADIIINRKMLSELAICDPAEFTKIVNMAKESLKNNLNKKKSDNVKVKKEESEKKVEKANNSTLTVAELRSIAKEQNVEGYSTMKKAELLAAIK